MSLQELQKFTFTSKYARYLPDKKRRETWKESVDRVKNMMIKKYPEALEEIIWAYSLMLKRRVLGSQRALQFGGEPILKKNARIFNCTSSYIDRLRFFQECMYLLLCGCGTGFSVQKHHIDKLPNLLKKKIETKKFIIEDSIEGWSDAVGVLISSYFNQKKLFPEYNGYNVQFDYRKIRPEGSYLSSSSGKAPGPEPLKKALSKIRNILDFSLEKELKKLRPIDCYDIIMHSANAVVSGGVRRSATICIFSHDDKEMLNAKVGNWFYENPQRGRSNNSILLLRNETSFEEFKKIVSYTKEFGEPGFVWADDKEFISNPCLEIGFYCYNESGDSGWQTCNLSTINCAKVTCEEDFYEVCKAAAIIGTLQAGFTSFPYLGKVSEEIIKKESLLGVSMTGIMEQHKICLDPKIQRKGVDVIKKTNEELAKKIGINPAARLTCVKPEGTTSCVLGTCSGIHPHHAKRYIRRVQSNKLDSVYQYFNKYNKFACEESVWSTNNTDDIVSFCIEVPDGIKLKNQVSAMELLETVKQTQQNWVIPGTIKERCTKPWLNHNVSNTITIKPKEWEIITKYIYDNKEYCCVMTLINFSGDKDYSQAPFVSIYLPSEIVSMYGEGVLFVSGLIEKSLELFEDDLWAACDVLLGLKDAPRGIAKKIWVDKCQKFVMKYMEGDIKKLTYCIKDVYNWKRWLDLKREYKDVDYTLLQEDQDFTSFETESACPGGRCEI